MKQHAIHRNDALRLLSDRQPHKLRLWKLQTGEILTYPQATLMSRHIRAGTHRVKLMPSGEIRMFRDCCLFEIDDLTIYW